ncbi:MAG: YesL family protein [Lachnospiraceae bacterium]|nr:YesL family protein [Lachnospiraceae bacterium]
MGKFFDMDSPVMRFLNRVGDLMILNFLMIVCCIPIITAGAAFTAMHYVLLKIVRGEEGYLIRGFFKSFRSNFRQATLIWLMMLLVVVIYIGDIWIINYSGLVFPKALVIAVVAVAILLLLIAVYVFPVLARFENSVKNTLKNAMLLAFANLPRTILMAVCYILPLVIGYFSTYALLFVILFGISAPAYAAAWIYSGIFKKLEPEAEELPSDLEFSLKIDEETGEIDG